MAITMQTAESTIEVKLPAEEAHKKWMEWTGKGGPGMPQGDSEQVSGRDLGAGLEKIEQGACEFEPAGDGTTMVRMRLRHNPTGYVRQGLVGVWIQWRHVLYLQR